MKKKIAMPLKLQHKTTNPSTNTKNVVSTTRKTTAKTPCSPMQKTLRNKLHRCTKPNRRCLIRQRGLTTTMKMKTKLVLRTTTAAETATMTAMKEVTGILAPEEAPRNV